LRRRDDAATRRFWRQSGARSCRRCEPKRREGRGGGGGRRFFVQSACNDRHAARDIRRLRFFIRRLGVPRGGSASASSYPPNPG
jgi:hypothetical protein